MGDCGDKGINRRQFLESASLAGVGLIFAAPVANAASPGAASEQTTGTVSAAPAVGRAASTSQRVQVAIVGAGDRGQALTRGFAAAVNCEVGWVCEVDQARRNKTIAAVEKSTGKAPKGTADFRTILENPDLDAVVIATANHWHAPAAILALKAGKHVYVEKPASHNAHEGELLALAQEKYGKLVQMGNQQRSHPESIVAVQRIREGLIGRPYQARGWFVGARGSIGRGKQTDVPPGLDYEMWQGPAPRVSYKDNVIHYNWHWHRRWGGGELANNGTHELDVARWAMGVDFPEKVTFSGGRYHFDDDWEFADTQDVAYEFGDKKSIVWTGRSCNAIPLYGRGRGVSVHGTEGTIVMDREGYALYDLKGKEMEKRLTTAESYGRKVSGIDGMTVLHINNFLDGIRSGSPLNSPISDARKSVLLAHLGNIAQFNGGLVNVDPSTGRIKGNPDAEKDWKREYEPGWEPTI